MLNAQMVLHKDRYQLMTDALVRKYGITSDEVMSFCQLYCHYYEYRRDEQTREQLENLFKKLITAESRINQNKRDSLRSRRMQRLHSRTRAVRMLPEMPCLEHWLALS